MYVYMAATLSRQYPVLSSLFKSSKYFGNNSESSANSGWNGNKLKIKEDRTTRGKHGASLPYLEIFFFFRPNGYGMENATKEVGGTSSESCLDKTNEE